MDQETLGKLRAHLDNELARLEAEIAEIDAEDRETLSEASGENNYRDHMADQGSATFARELDMTLEGNARESLLAIERALERVADGTYGVCTRCGKAIAQERLEAVPAADLCIACKEREESA